MRANEPCDRIYDSHTLDKVRFRSLLYRETVIDVAFSVLDDLVKGGLRERVNLCTPKRHWRCPCGANARHAKMEI